MFFMEDAADVNAILDHHLSRSVLYFRNSKIIIRETTFISPIEIALVTHTWQSYKYILTCTDFDKFVVSGLVPQLCDVPLFLHLRVFILLIKCRECLHIQELTNEQMAFIK